MDALDVLRTVYATGVVLLPVGTDSLEASGPPLSDQHRAMIRENKAALLAELARQHVGDRDNYPSVVPRRYATPTTCIAPGACQRLGPCGQFITRHACNSRAGAQAGEAA